MLEKLTSNSVRHDTRLGTQRLILRAPAMTDAPSITALLGDVEVSGQMARVPCPYRPRDAKAWLAADAARRAAGEALSFAITRRDDWAGFCVGVCALERRADGDAELSLWLGRPFWGRGLMTEAATSLLRYGFTALGHRRVRSGWFADNDRAARLHERLGFGVTGEAVEYSVARRGDVRTVTAALARHALREPAAPLAAVG